jgi:serine/threonine protein kinase
METSKEFSLSLFLRRHYLIPPAQPNILTEDNGTPVLADFGQWIFSNFRDLITAFEVSARYKAPEMLTPDPPLTQKTDVFAFSMVALEVSNILSILISGSLA